MSWARLLSPACSTRVISTRRPTHPSDSHDLIDKTAGFDGRIELFNEELSEKCCVRPDRSLTSSRTNLFIEGLPRSPRPQPGERRQSSVAPMPS